MDRVEVVIAGAGVVGLAIARQLAEQGREVLLLERETAVGTGTSSRNSEVIHAGIYYQPGSLKARLCFRGRDLLYDFAQAQGVAHRRCGKLIVATDRAQIPALHALAAQAADCGVTDLEFLDAGAARAMEPELACVAALWSPSTGIVDSHGLMQALLHRAEAAGAMLGLGTRVTGVTTGEGFEITTEDAASGESFQVAAKVFVNAAGLDAPALAGTTRGLAPAHVPRAFYARGNYYGLPGRPAFSRLIYPVPEPGGLGIHLTLDLGGGMRFGPDVDWIDGVDTRVNGARRAHFETEIRRYWPALPQGALAPVGCGIRPKIAGPGDRAADFRIDGPKAHGIPGLVNLFGIESPGLTAALAIAEEVAARLD